MRISFPHMGNSYIVFKAIAEALGLDYIIPPFPNKATLDLGARYGPEFVCVPFKVNLGNFIHALDAGADTLFMAGGISTCRFGYYSRILGQILKDMGYQFDLIELNQQNIIRVYKTLKSLELHKPFLPVFLRAFHIMWQKAKVLAFIEDAKRKTMPYEKNNGETKMILKECLRLLDQAKTRREIKGVQEKSLNLFNSIKKDNKDNLPKIGLIGEVYTVLEPYINLDLEDYLSKLGVEVHTTFSLYHWLLHIFKIDLGGKKLRKLAKPYLNYNPAGEGQYNVGSTIRYARSGFDGVIHLYPFTCMPGLIAHSILSQLSQDYEIPVFNYSLDEQTGRGGFYTRLEAFVDLVKRRRKYGSLSRS